MKAASLLVLLSLREAAALATADSKPRQMRNLMQGREARDAAAAAAVHHTQVSSQEQVSAQVNDSSIPHPELPIPALKLPFGAMCQKLYPDKHIDKETAKDFLRTDWFVQLQLPTTYEKADDCSKVEVVKRPWYKQPYWTYYINNKGLADRNHGDNMVETGDKYCLKATDHPAKFVRGKCKRDPNIPRALVGLGAKQEDWWIVSYNKAEGYGVIASGQPDLMTLPLLGGPQKCLYTGDKSVWIVTDTPYPSDTVLTLATTAASFKGMDTSKLHRVEHPFKKCPGAFEAATKGEAHALPHSRDDPWPNGLTGAAGLTR